MMDKERQIIYNKSNGRCWYCGDKLEGKRWHKDYFEPVIRDGGEITYPERDHIDNLVPACDPCNLFKAAFSLDDLRYEIEQQVERARQYSVNFRTAERFGLVKVIGDGVKFHYEKVNLNIKGPVHLVAEPRSKGELNSKAKPETAKDLEKLSLWYFGVTLNLSSLSIYGKTAKYEVKQKYDDYHGNGFLFGKSSIDGYEYSARFWDHVIGRLYCGGIANKSYGQANIVDEEQRRRLVGLAESVNKKA